MAALLRRPVSLLAALALTSLTACTGTDVPDLLASPLGTPSTLRLPNAVSGGDPGGGRPVEEGPKVATTPEEVAELKAEAEALWAKASSTRDQEDAGDLYGDLGDDYPESPRAAEARYRQGAAYFQAKEHRAAVEILARYMDIAPVNPHLADVEEMIYESGIVLLRPRSGIDSIIYTNETGIRALEYVTATFPVGEYADDALLRLAQYYQAEEDWPSAVLHYKELLVRYPDSEWSFRARLSLGDCYLQRDQGSPYHAGFVDLDPRETYPTEQARLLGADVRSSPRKALEQYEAFLERIELDPARRSEYGREVAYATRMRATVRESLAKKDLEVGRWYRSQGDRRGTRTYLTYAARFADTPSGRSAARELAAAGGPMTLPEGTGARKEPEPIEDGLGVPPARYGGLAPAQPVRPSTAPVPARPGATRVPARPVVPQPPHGHVPPRGHVPPPPAPRGYTPPFNPATPLPTRPLPTRPLPTRPPPTRPVPIRTPNGSRVVPAPPPPPSNFPATPSATPRAPVVPSSGLRPLVQAPPPPPRVPPVRTR